MLKRPKMSKMYCDTKFKSNHFVYLNSERHSGRLLWYSNQNAVSNPTRDAFGTPFRTLYGTPIRTPFESLGCLSERNAERHSKGLSDPHSGRHSGRHSERHFRNATQNHFETPFGTPFGTPFWPPPMSEGGGGFTSFKVT